MADNIDKGLPNITPEPIAPKPGEMEVDIINMVKSMFYGDEKCSGNLSYGGTESIFLACKTTPSKSKFSIFMSS